MCLFGLCLGAHMYVSSSLHLYVETRQRECGWRFEIWPSTIMAPMPELGRDILSKTVLYLILFINLKDYKSQFIFSNYWTRPLTKLFGTVCQRPYYVLINFLQQNEGLGSQICTTIVVNVSGGGRDVPLSGVSSIL